MFAETGTILNSKCHRKLLSSHFLHHGNPATLIQQGISGVSDGYIERLGSTVGGVYLIHVVDGSRSTDQSCHIRNLVYLFQLIWTRRDREGYPKIWS
jgi:hypothetical protein